MDIANIKNSLVVSTNDLVYAKYEMSLWQKRVFIYAIGKLEKTDTEFKPIRMNVVDIIKFYKGSDNAKAYRAIIEAPKYLDRAIEIPYVSEKGFLRYGFVRLLQRYTIPADNQNENQYIEIHFNNDLKPHLLELKEKFLKYDIRNVIELQSIYSFRMFEILKSYEFRKDIELEVDYLREILEIGTIYKAYKDFRIRIIDKAQEDLLKYCDIAFTYEEKKGVKGKKIESLMFHIRKNEAQQRDVKKENTYTPKEQSPKEKEYTPFEIVENKEKNKNTEQEKSIITETKEPKENNGFEKLFMELSPIVVSQFGVSVKVFMGLTEAHTEGEIRQAIQVTQKTMQAGKIENIAGFFVEAVRGKYTDPKQKKKQVEVEKKAKLAETKRVEEVTEKQIKDQKQAVYEQEVKIFTQLIKEDASLAQILIDKVRSGMFATYYKTDKSFEENLIHPMLKGAFLNVAKEVRPKRFRL
jgi:plasmid replication initiation protein